MKHVGDIKNLNGRTIEKVNCIIGGSPCQDLSIAGKRAGLAGKRSGLFMQQIRIVKEMRENDRESGRADVDVRPRFMVWENVPGALSSNKGEDFRAVLEEICKISDETVTIPEPPKGKWNTSGCIMGDGYSVAWRVMDAQYFGVPQRRRRIALVADFGGHSAYEILFEPEGLPRNHPESRKAREGTAGRTENSLGAAGFLGGQGVKAHGIGYEPGKSPTLRAGVTPNVVVLNDQGGAVMGVSKNVTGTLRAQEHGHQPIVYNGETVTSPTNASNPKPGDPCHTLGATGAGRAICIQGNCIDRADTAGCNGKGWRYDQCYTLNTIDRPAVYDARGNGDGDTVPTLTGDHQNRVTDYTALCLAEAYSFDSLASNSMKSSNPHSGCRKVDVSKTLDTTNPDPSKNQGGIAIVQKTYSRDSYSKFSETDTGTTLTRHLGAEFGDIVASVDCRNLNENADLSGTLQHKDSGGYSLNYINPVRVNKTVRRLTPLECERLQGYPDTWTLIGEHAGTETWKDENGNEYPVEVRKYRDSNGKLRKVSDSARYKALGNSIALPPWRIVLGRICEHLPDGATMGSLFDGIGGFPLIWEEINGSGSAVWASEIEEFPIAVTKERFKDDFT